MSEENTQSDESASAGFAGNRAELDAFNKAFIDQFRANRGVIAEGRLAGVTSLLLHTKGTKSGELRISPLTYLSHEGRWIIGGSFAGSPKHPAWVHNLRANPNTQVEVGDGAAVTTHDVTAREVLGEERDQFWEFLVQAAPIFADYQAKTDGRVIPVFELVRA